MEDKFAACIDDRMHLMGSNQQLDAAFLEMAQEMGHTILKMKKMLNIMKGPVKDKFKSLREEMKNALGRAQKTKNNARAVIL